ncbi:MAG: hypothetical protein Q4A34_03590 [Candidatus Saccharibacteria bacterium]|nr:hypothetical protein [Candidatus Saccharibacteria bacterium]
MYSGTTLNTKSGNLMGVHQKIDRVARRHIAPLLPAWCDFPTTKQILHFEGNNGPDGIKRKSPAVDEPWHFIDPQDAEDVRLLDMIDQHIVNLAAALAANNHERAAFEAAWMAHAITDGLTPAHHFPLEQVLKELRGEGMETRNSIMKKNIMPGENPLELLKNNWQFWGAKGAMTMHVGFELGVASVVAYKRFSKGRPSGDDIQTCRDVGFRTWYVGAVHQVAELGMYEKFAEHGWTTELARQTNGVLMPLIIRAVVLGWLSAVSRAEELRHAR